MAIKKRRLRGGSTGVFDASHTRLVQTRAILIAFVMVGVGIVALSFASTQTASTEPEDSAQSGCVNNVDDTSASGSKSIQFGATNGCASLAGAKLPITYDLASITGSKRFVDDNGSDTTGNGTVDAPYATIAKAYSTVASGDTIIVRGGNYNESGLVITQNKSVTIKAYPGETPQFDGAQSVSSGWNSEGPNAYHAYTPQPVTNGSGLTFTTGQGLTGDGVGKYPDQAWVGDTQLQQVTQKTSLTDSTFWVDSANNRLYMTQANVSKGSVELSDKDTFATIFAPNTTIEGLKISRYSNSADDYGVIKFMASADNGLLKHIDLSDAAFIGIAILGDSHINTNTTLQNVTLTHSNWMGVSALYTEGFSMKAVKITGMNQFDEFTYSIQSGGLKTSRTRNTKVTNSDVSDNNGPGLWFDQSNLTVHVAGNRIVNNASSGVFYEISDDLLLINNYITATGDARAVKLAASSGLKLINNTIIGGSDVVGVYVDERSKPGCSDPAQPLCGNSYESDRDTVRSLPPTMTWIPAIDLMINNIIAYPTGQGYCGAVTALCITNTNAGTNVALNKVIHPANASIGVPQTFMDNNVYANGASNIAITIQGRYTNIPTFTEALASSPVSILGLEQNSKSGNSWVTSAGAASSSLVGAHSQATPIPTDPEINAYMPAGYKHYGPSYR